MAQSTWLGNKSNITTLNKTVFPIKDLRTAELMLYLKDQKSSFTEVTKHCAICDVAWLIILTRQNLKNH
jgi:hypothetical protein